MFLTLFLDVIKSLVFYRTIRDDVLRLLVDVLVFMGGAMSNSKTDGKKGVDPEGWLSEVLVSIKVGEILLKLPSSLEGVDGLGGSHAFSEPGHRVLMDFLGIPSYFDFGLRLGEGTGAVLLFPIIDASTRILSEMPTLHELAIRRYY